MNRGRDLSDQFTLKLIRNGPKKQVFYLLSAGRIAPFFRPAAALARGGGKAGAEGLPMLPAVMKQCAAAIKCEQKKAGSALTQCGMMKTADGISDNYSHSRTGGRDG
jgi:hypothetical protein